MQIYYTCEECNRNWNGVTLGKSQQTRLCEPCIMRCHKGHKGVRKLKEGKISCVCEQLCQAIQSKCNARSIDDGQLQIQQCGFEERAEWKRREERNVRNILLVSENVQHLICLRNHIFLGAESSCICTCSLCLARW